MEPPPPDPVRLDALAAATKKYATYSTTAFGLGYSAWGGLLIAAGLACIASPAWGPSLVFVAVPAWFPLVRWARRRYQHLGRVVGPEDGMSARRARQNGLLGAAVMTGPFLLKLAGHRAAWSASQGAPAEVAMLAAALATLLTLALAIAWGRGYRDTYPPTMLLLFWWVAAATDERFLPASRGEILAPALWLCGAGLFLALLGANQHEAWRGLERRLARLRGAAP